jgi:hypothetical protein
MEWADKYTDEELFFMVNGLIAFIKKDKENVSVNNNELLYGFREQSNIIRPNRQYHSQLRAKIYQGDL